MSTSNKSQFPKAKDFKNDYLENQSMKILDFIATQFLREINVAKNF